jgi:hypothetical protein
VGTTRDFLRSIGLPPGIPNRPEVALALGPLVEIAFCDRLPGGGG